MTASAVATSGCLARRMRRRVTHVQPLLTACKLALQVLGGGDACRRSSTTDEQQRLAECLS